MRIGFIGAGRVGTGLGSAFAAAGQEVTCASSRSEAAALGFARAVPGAVRCTPQEVVERSDAVFVTVPDDAIESVVAGLRWRAGVLCVHCSGAAELDVLRKAQADGARSGGFHPLYMFGERGQPERLAGAYVAVAGSDSAAATLEELARCLGMRPFRLPEEARPLYHCSANFAAGFVVALLAEAATLWRAAGLDERDAIPALLPLLRGAADNVERLGPAGALSTAVSRGDLGTLRRHLDALAARAPQTLALYRTLSRRTLPLAVAKGTLEPARASEIEALLRGAEPRP